MVALLSVGDPLADAVIAEMDTLGKEGRRILNAGLADGLASLTERPPAITALLRQLETVPEWVNPDMLRQGEVSLLSIPMMWFELSAITSALVHTYSSPAIARLLVQTGRLTSMAPRRLMETTMWAGQTTMPGGLLRGAPGYQSTAQVRLLHARMRTGANKRGWDTAEWGVPINQVDLARTWLDFTLSSFGAIAALGIELTKAEQQDLYRYWQYVAHLLGLENDNLHKEVTDHDSARELGHLLDMTIGAPDENSRALTAAMIQAQVEVLSSGPQPLMQRTEFTELIHGILRNTLGDDRADELGIPHSAASPFLALTVQANKAARHWQTLSPESAEQALKSSTATWQGAVEGAAGVAGSPTYRQHAQTGLTES
nr:oxygenase MpaB family protein [Murinocardiopsis flavida]